MHYYQFNIGDYKSHTAHLTVIEDICYRRLLDFYYLHEKPLTQPVDNLARLLLLTGYENQLNSVLNEFFILTDLGYTNTRADKEISQYQSFSEAGKRGAAKRWLKAGYSPPNPPPIANNKHKTINNKHIATINLSEKTLLKMANDLGLSTIGLDKYSLVDKINAKIGVK